jgi:hypothetical protein
VRQLAAANFDGERNGVLREAAHVLEAELGRDVNAAMGRYQYYKSPLCDDMD